MKKSEVKIGKVYTARVDDKMVPVRIDGENGHGGWDATNLTTGKKIHIKLPQRLRGEVNVPAAKAGDAANPTATVGSERAVSKAPPKKATPSPAAATTAKRGVKATSKAKAGKPAARAKRGQTKAKRSSGLDAAARVLEKAKGPMTCREIVKEAFQQGYWKSDGKTPHATVYSAIIREIVAKGQQSRFQKVDRGKFAINPAGKVPRQRSTR